MSSSPNKKNEGPRKTPGEGTAHVRTRTPRPDELTRETFEFIAAIDRYKRRHMRSFLSDEQVLTVAHELGWFPPHSSGELKPPAEEIERFAQAREKYRLANGRLFPSWSELFELLMRLGYVRVREPEQDDEAA